MVWFTDKQNKTHLVWTSKDNKTMIPEVQIIDDGKCFWKVTEEGQRTIGGEVTNGVVDVMNAKTELTKQIYESSLIGEMYLEGSTDELSN